jgi:hypothetical protein
MNGVVVGVDGSVGSITALCFGPDRDRPDAERWRGPEMNRPGL